MDADLFEIYKSVINDRVMKEYTSTVSPYELFIPYRHKPTPEDVKHIMLDVRTKRNQRFCEIKYTSQILPQTL